MVTTVTANDIVTQGLRKSGVLGLGQTANASDIADALADLNDMLAQWRRKRWLVYHLVQAFTTSTGANSYTVGPAANIAVDVRPDRIEFAFVRQVQNAGLPIDYPLEILPSREDYDRVALKGLISFPKYAFYDATYPVGTLFLYPVPNATIYQIHLSLKDVLQQFATLQTAVILPQEYIPAMKFNLAKRLRQAYGKGLRPDVELNALARDALETVRGGNMQVPQLTMPSTLVNPSLYNIYSDQAY